MIWKHLSHRCLLITYRPWHSPACQYGIEIAVPFVLHPVVLCVCAFGVLTPVVSVKLDSWTAKKSAKIKH
jgi:hypothetical protein